MDIREMIAELVFKISENHCPKEDIECYSKTCRECFTQYILSLETDTERLAVVLKEPVLPGVEQSICTRESRKAQQDMLKAGFVQEVKG